ncbi:Hypothetical protein CINCED_3A003397 [Cinara cedri]|uniref:Uncharacterized protein n=1 Tax=Cinara cedri TaxID=506608 RepID=A0A5E4M6A7_9HEMI|nr:Hypothetical protein CINCED_3A003397 [Cinara cedri]
MPSTLLNGDKSYKDNKKVTRNLNAADAFHKFQYMMTNWKTNSLKTSCDDNTTALAPRATVTKANGRDKTGHPLSKDYDENTREPVWRATVTEVNGRALTGNPVSDYGGSPEEAEKYYDEVDQPAVVWKTGIYGSFKVGRRNSADDDDDDDDDEHQNMMLEDVTCENM